MIENFAAIVLIALGLYACIKGKMPFLRCYEGIKDIKKHAYIEGTTCIVVGLIVFSQEFFVLERSLLFIVILAILTISIVFEIVFKVF